MSVIGPFIVVGSGCFLLMVSSSEQLPMLKCVGYSELLGGALGVVGAGVDQLRRHSKWGWGYGLGVGLGLCLVFLSPLSGVVAVERMAGGLLAIEAGLLAVMAEALRHHKLPPGSLLQRVAAFRAWVYSALLLTLFALAYRARPLALIAALGTALLVAFVSGAAFLVRRRELSSLCARAVPVSMTPSGSGQRVVEIGVGGQWHSLEGWASYRKRAPRLWLHGDLQRGLGMLHRSAALAGTCLVLAVTAGALHLWFPTWGVSLTPAPAPPAPPLGDWSEFRPAYEYRRVLSCFRSRYEQPLEQH
jgi:hypothetical protein